MRPAARRARSRCSRPTTTTTTAPAAVAEKITADKVLVCTGASPRQLPFAKSDGKTIFTSYELLTIDHCPKSMIAIGSDAIGMEFAYFMNAFGCDVTVVEMLDRILPVEDDDISKAAQKSFEKQGIKFKTGSMVKDIKTGKGGAKVTVADAKDESKTETLDAEVVLVAIGVKGRFDGLFDDALGVKVEKDAIVTDARTSDGPDLPDLRARHLRDRRRASARRGSPTSPARRASSRSRRWPATIRSRSTTTRFPAAPTPIRRSPRSV